MDRKEKQHCLLQIRSCYNTFNRTEQRIADYILEDPGRILDRAINEVADEIGFATSTVFRFCKKIGFKGYQAMKLVLAQELVDTGENQDEEILVTDNQTTITGKMFHSKIKALENTLELLNTSAMKEAIQLILAARKVEIFSCGDADLVARDAYRKFFNAGIDISCQMDPYLKKVSASRLCDEDVALLITHTEASKDILDILDILQENNVRTVAITHFSQTFLSERADVTLSTFSEEDAISSTDHASHIAKQAIMDAIFVNVLVATREHRENSVNPV